MFAAQSDLAWKQGDIFLGRTADGKEAGFAAERGAICVAGSRAGKGSALIIPNLLRWPHAALVIDPKGENASATWEKRETFGPVYVLDPFGVADVPERLRAACNPLENISADSTTAREDIRVIADGLVMRSNEKDAVWDDGAVTVIAGLIAHAIITAETPSLPAMRSLLKCPPDELVDVFAAIMRRCSGLIGWLVSVMGGLLSRFECQQLKPSIRRPIPPATNAKSRGSGFVQSLNQSVSQYVHTT
jgi:type IV secretion system protein VirD4